MSKNRKVSSFKLKDLFTTKGLIVPFDGINVFLTSLFNLFKFIKSDLFDKISATSQVRKPLLKIPYVLAYYPVYILTKVTALLNIKSNINSFKIYSLHNKLTYCSSEKAKREFNYHVTDLDKTVLNIVNSFKETGY